MNITFLVGNGFDISAGIDTSYSGFYKWYCEQRKNEGGPEPGWVQDFKNDILKDMKKPPEERMWSDFEWGLGDYVQKFDADTMYQFVDCYEDAVANLQKYIELQMECKVRDLSSQQIESFSRGLLYFTSELSEASKEATKGMLPPQINQDVWFNFISFNYTDVLDKFVQAVSNTPLTRWSKGVTTYYVKVFFPVLHIHGSIDNMPLMGVNNKDQIRSDLLKENVDLQRCLVKPIASAAVGNLVQKKAKNWIQESNIICLWGLSIGETDAQWWEEIMSWLLKDKTNQLIVFWYTGGKLTKRLHTKVLRTQEKIYNKLFMHSSYTNDDMEEAKKRIHIVFDTQKVLRVYLHDKEKELAIANQ